MTTYTITYLDYRSRLYGSEVIQAGSFTSARQGYELANPDREVISVRRES